MIALLAALSTARADMLPPPTRPDWDDPEDPLPVPPEVLVAGLLVVGAAATAVLVAVRRGRRPTTA